jgi:hypothetical protein
MNKPRRICGSIAGVLLLCSACGRTPPIANPIPGVPLSQQRTVHQYELDGDWPFEVAVGTLGCRTGAVMFRSGTVTYALNDAARSRFASPEAIRMFRSVPPSNPLRGITQNERMRIFADASACDRGPAALQCRQRLRERAGLSDADMKQIDAEGIERRWPPLQREWVPLDAIAAAGQRLCGT